MITDLMFVPTIPEWDPLPQGWSRREWARPDRNRQHPTYIFVYNLCGGLRWMAQVSGTRISMLVTSRGEYELFVRVPNPFGLEGD